jgi:hypothetical protein
LVHGHLDAGRILLTAEGVLKIAGLGEPRWLIQDQKAEVRGQRSEIRDQESRVRGQESGVRNQESEGESGPDIGSDLDALARIAVAWVAPAPKKKGTRTKAMPKPLRRILDRLKADDPAIRYPSLAALLEDLDQIGDQVPDNAEAWDKLLSQIRDQGKEEAALKESA